jgi:hypothetical protein
MKPGGYTPAAPPTGPRAERANETRLGGNSVLVDGTMGFDDRMETDDAGRGLYSDQLVPANQANGTGNASYRKDFSYGRDLGYRQGRRDDARDDW